ncbi:Ig-like domain-containing protein [Clostridium tetani]|uniref:Ig-like domain-containing protein n=2 Tax=Clostridium tetani TaxID=1513 RepID=UPI0013E96750|nr:Ig-like domain-containing protein [Clostridium tetani]
MNKKSKKLVSFIVTFLMIFSTFNFGALNSKVFSKEKEINVQATISPQSIEVSPGESFTLNVKSEDGNYFVYKSKIPGIKYGKIKIVDGIKITIPKNTKLGEYKLTNLEIYNVNERALMSFPEALRSQKIDQQIKFKTGKVCDLSDVTIVIKDKTGNEKETDKSKVIIGEKEDGKIDSGNKNNSNIKIRVEGEKNTLFNKEFDIKNEVYVKELISNAVGKENIKGLDSNFIDSILGEEKTDSSGWMYYLVDNNGEVLLGNSIDIQKIKDIKENYYKEMVWFMTKWIGGITCIPKIDIQHTGNTYKLKITEQNIMLGIDPRLAKDVNVKVEGVGEYKTDEKGEVSFKVTGGKHKIDIYKNAKDLDGNDYPAIVRQCFSVVGEASESETKLQNVIKGIKKYYKNNPNDSYLNAISFNHINFGERKSFKLEESENVSAIADNIIGIIAISKNPYNYEGVNYVEKLSKVQRDNGSFVIGDNDSNSVTAQSEAIIAMDMASAKYNVDKALKYLIGLANDGKYEDIDNTTRALVALSKHKEIRGVKELINSCLNDLKDKQLEGGGFDYYELGNSPYSTSPVIQALIAVGENPISDKWKKGERTPVDALLACKISDNGFEMAEGMGGGVSDIMATNLTFAAIADLYKQESMYNSFLFKVEEKQDNSKTIKDEIESIKSYYEKTLSYDYNTILGLNAAGVDTKKLEGKISLKNKESIKFLAEDVISIVGAGKNPRNYNGKNYVQKLIDVLKNPKDSKSKYTLNKNYFYGLIAINIASASKEDINMLIEKIKNQYKIDRFKTIGDAPLAIISLSPYKDKAEVNEIIKSCINYLKEEQLDNGAFTLDKKQFKNGDSQDTALVIEALVAAGEDPLSGEWIKNGKNLLDVLLSFKVGNGYIYDSMFGTLDQDMYTGFAFRALLALKDKKTIFQKLKIKYEPEKDKTSIIKKIINDLRKQYKSKESYDFSEALALNYSSDNSAQYLQDVSKKYKNIEECKKASDVAKNIMGIIASGNNPKKFNGKNYIEMLSTHQVKDGTDKGKFILSEEDRLDPSIQAYSIIALDMANAKYNKESAIKALLQMNKDGAYLDTDTTAIVITALSNHNNNEEINKIINSSIEFIKDKQNSNAGFSKDGNNSLVSTAIVIQGLIANKIDPLGNEWTKNGNTMLDVILKAKVENSFGTPKEDAQVFMALSDLYKGSSMFKSIKVAGSVDFDSIFNELKDYYETKDNNYNYIQALALNKLGISKEIIASRLQLREEEPEYLNYDFPTVSHAKNIIAILSAGLNPKDYKGENYIKKLKNAQNDKGEFKLTKDERYSSISQAYAIIALDMCKESYDVEKAVKVLKESLKDKRSYRLKRLAPTMIALSNHRDISEVNIILKNCTLSLKNLQQDNGEFSSSGRPGDEMCSEDTALAIQALVAVGQDVLSPRWQQNGKTPIDALMHYKVENHFIYDNIKASYDEYTDEATGMALAALVDVYNSESMFKALNSNKPDEEKEKPEEPKLDEKPEKSKETKVEEISLDKSLIELKKEDTIKLIATITPDNVTNKNVIWTSGDENIATVDNEGNVRALKAGEVVIKVVTEDGQKFAECKVVVKDKKEEKSEPKPEEPKKIKIEKVFLDKSLIELKEKDTIKFNVIITPDNATNKNIIWTSSDEKVATVDNKGNVRALKSGEAVIKVVTEDGQKFAECKVVVKVEKEVDMNSDKKEIEIETLTTYKEFRLGSDAEVTIKATNKTKENKDVAIIVGVFNKDGRLVNYGAVEQNIKANENVNLTADLPLPNKGEYTVKAFVWDSLNGMNSISKVIEIPVK